MRSKLRGLMLSVLAALGLFVVQVPTHVLASAPLCYAPINGPAEQVVVHAGTAGGVNVRANPGVGGQLLCLVPNDTVLRVDPGSTTAPAPGLSGQWRHVWVIGPAPSYQPTQGWSVIESLDPRTAPSQTAGSPPNFSQFDPNQVRCGVTIRCDGGVNPLDVVRDWFRTNPYLNQQLRDGVGIDLAWGAWQDNAKAVLMTAVVFLGTHELANSEEGAVESESALGKIGSPSVEALSSDVQQSRWLQGSIDRERIMVNETDMSVLANESGFQDLINNGTIGTRIKKVSPSTGYPGGQSIIYEHFDKRDPGTVIGESHAVLQNGQTVHGPHIEWFYARDGIMWLDAMHN